MTSFYKAGPEVRLDLKMMFSPSGDCFVEDGWRRERCGGPRRERERERCGGPRRERERSGGPRREREREMWVYRD
jgi:hypothetical protein